MNTCSYLLVPGLFVVILTIIAVAWTTTHRNYITSVVSGVLGFCALVSILILYAGKEGLTKEYLINQKSSTIPQFSTLSNGVYSVLGTYRGPDRKWLAILRNTTITSIDRTNKVVVATVQENDYPILVVTDEPIAGPQYKETIPFTGFAEIGINQTNKFIRDYNPFRMSRK